MRGLGNAGQHGQHAAIVLAGIGLTGDGQGAGKTHLFGHQAVDAFDFFLVVVAQAHEAGLRAGSAFGTTKL